MMIDFTEEEIVALNRMIDLAVRNAGLAIAPMALMINNKLVAVIRERQINGGINANGNHGFIRPADINSDSG